MRERKPVPKPRPETAPYWESISRGVLKLPKCNHCLKFFFYPRFFCPRCFQQNISWIKSEGWGVIYSFTIIHRAAIPSFSEDVPYVYALVDLNEGIRMATNIIHCNPEDVYIGMPVKAVFRLQGTESLLVKFEPR